MTQKETLKLLEKRFEFRDIRPEEIQEAIEIEQICFPPNEACSPQSMQRRLTKAPDLCLVAIDKETGKVAGFLNGLATDEPAFHDGFFTNEELHNPSGKYVMLLGLDVRPEYRGQGLATEIVRRYAQREKEKGRCSLVLTCLERLVGMYQKMNFHDDGMANSTWGGEEWHQMSRVL